MNYRELSRLSRSAVLTGLLLSSVGLSSVAAQAEPSGIGDCELKEVATPSGPMIGWIGHPCPQPRHGLSNQVTEAGLTTVVTQEGQFPPVDPFANPPGSNFLMNVDSNLFDFDGNEMPNTLPSTSTKPYNLHDGPVLIKRINPINPEDDLN